MTGQVREEGEARSRRGSTGAEAWRGAEEGLSAAWPEHSIPRGHQCQSPGLTTEVLAGRTEAKGQPLAEVKIKVRLHLYKFPLAAKPTRSEWEGLEAGRPMRRPGMVNPQAPSLWAVIIFLVCLPRKPELFNEEIDCRSEAFPKSVYCSERQGTPEFLTQFKA